MRAIKLTSGKNTRLYSIVATLSTLCWRHLAYKFNPDLDAEETEVVEKGREYLNDVRKGLIIRGEFKTRPFSFEPETVHSLNALEEVFIIAQDEKKIHTLLDTVDETLSSIIDKSKIDEEKVINAITFLDRLSEVVSRETYNPEASHIL
nr:hypothetical protein 2 [bacterium]